MHTLSATWFYSICFVGLLISILSLLENRIKWIAAFCALFGNGCQRISDFSLLKLPIAWWGIVFYLLLILARVAYLPVIPWLVIAGLGFELTFIVILLRIRSFCVFCALNALIVAFLVWRSFDPSHILPGGATALFFFIGSFALMRMENRPLLVSANTSGRQTKESRKVMDKADTSPDLGSEDAPVQIMEFSDYQCPACRKSRPVIEKLKKAYSSDIRWVFKNLPLPQHDQAETLALAAHCAGDQGKFWEYHDRLFGLDPIPDEEGLASLAAELGLNAEDFRQCLANGCHRGKIEKDKAAAKKAGVAVTPTLIINGRIFAGTPDYEKLRSAIAHELQNRTGGDTE